MAKTFREVGAEEGLEGFRLERFVLYMKKRWAKEESMQCQTGYAAEWAQRFMNGIEYSASDIDGRAVLQKIDMGE